MDERRPLLEAARLLRGGPECLLWGSLGWVHGSSGWEAHWVRGLMTTLGPVMDGRHRDYPRLTLGLGPGLDGVHVLHVERNGEALLRVWWSTVVETWTMELM